MDKLKDALQDEPIPQQTPSQRKQEITRLIRELQHRRKLTALWNKAGVRLTDPTAIAQELRTFWSEVMAPGTKTVPDCLAFLSTLPLKPTMKGAAKLLIKPLIEELVLTALEKLKRGSSPGPDGLPAEALMAFPSILVPKMIEMIQQFLAQGKISEKWATAILAPIPKEKGSISVTDLRPLCLQNVLFKWVSMALYLMLQDLILYVTPPEQKSK